MNQNLSLYLTARLVSLTGDALGNVALLWWLITSTRSAAAASFAMAMYSICFAIALPLSGVLGDRMFKRDVMLLSEMVNVILTSILVFLSLDSTTSPLLFASVMAMKSISAASLNSASTGFIGEACMGEGFLSTFKYISYIIGVSGLLGGAAGGAIVATWGVPVALVITALSSLIGAVLLFFIVVSNRPLTLRAGAGILSSCYGQLREGAVFLKNISNIKSHVGWLAIFGFVYGPLMILVAVFIKDIYGLGALWLGLAELALAVGVLFGGALSNKMQMRFCSGHIILANMLGVGGAFFIIAFADTLHLTIVALFLLGICFAFLNINMTSRIWALVPEDMGSRITSIFTLVGRLAGAISMAMIGFFLSFMSINLIVAFLGCLWLIVCAVFYSQREFRLFVSADVESIRRTRLSISPVVLSGPP